MKRILILGGTRFIGRTFLEVLLAKKKSKKYEVTLFNRGQTNPDLFPDLEHIKGDRDDKKAIKKLMKKDWDYVIDFSCYFPKPLKKLIERGKGRIGRYIFTSTISVYDFDKIEVGTQIKEKAPLLTYSKEDRKDKSWATYGKRKVACEDILQEADWLDKIILRPSIVFGRYDYTDRHYYWLHRIKTQDQILVPDNGKEEANYTFVEDYAELLWRSIRTKKHRTVYNATTHRVVSLQKMLDSAAEYLQKQPDFVSLSAKELAKSGIKAGREGIALWQGADRLLFDHNKAEKDFDLQYYMMEDALARTIDYYDKQDWYTPNYGWSIKEEQNFLRKLKK